MIKIKTLRKKITIVFCIILIITCIIVITYNFKRYASNNLNEREYGLMNNIYDENQKEINNIAEIKTPDEIIYYKDDIKITINKENPSFQKILKTNQNRNIGELLLLEVYVIVDNKNHNFLEYRYNEDYSIYFTLNTNEENYIWIPKECKTFVSGAYGFIDTATELIKYLD